MPKRWTFIVEGKGQFPFDMLRYDRCCPYAHEDIVWMMDDKHHRSMKLVAYVAPPTVARWNSFGWTVDMVKLER